MCSLPEHALSPVRHDYHINLVPEPAGGLLIAVVVQVKNPEDTSNFMEPDADAGKDPNAHRYQSVGLFRDF